MYWVNLKSVKWKVIKHIDKNGSLFFIMVCYNRGEIEIEV